MGRHIVGYEIQKVLGAVDWLWQDQPSHSEKIGVMGYGEGGLLALYSAALDETRIEAVVVSGYFDSRQRVWAEPIYRDVFGLLQEFGDAEIASLIAPRVLIVEHCEAPKIDGPPKAREGRSGAAPGKWSTPEFNSVEAEVKRANDLFKSVGSPVRLVHGNEGMSVAIGSERTLELFLQALNVKKPSIVSGPAAAPLSLPLDTEGRAERQLAELVEHTQRLLRESERIRDEIFWRKLKINQDYQTSIASLKSNLWEEVIGRFPRSTLPLNARSRKILEKEKWTGYDVVLDVFPDVFAWGVLLLPKDLKPGERRPVVVCQHGLEGLPEDTITEDPASRGYGPYKAFSARLAEQGFVVFAPHNPYRGRDDFRVLQRKAHPLKKSLFSFILAQHDRILDWLSEQPFVDPARLGFYGLSYGGKTAMRVPSLLDRYALSICSADFNEWIKKNVTVDSAYSYLFTGEYDMPEFNLGHTFNYAEMAALIAPRPFMVERGHDDGVAPDEWVAYEYAKVRRLYAKLGIAERTEIEFFNGPHTINGVRTFQFLRTHLNWPETR
jgi:dienelactone hydrolase